MIYLGAAGDFQGSGQCQAGTRTVQGFWGVGFLFQTFCITKNV